MDRRLKLMDALPGLMVAVVVASGLAWAAVPTSAASDSAEVRAVLNGKPMAVVVLALVGAMAPSAFGAASDQGFIEVTSTAKGHEMAAAAATRQAALGAQTSVSDLRVWRLGPDDYFVATQLPSNLSTSTTTNGANKTVKVISFDVSAATSALPDSHAGVIGPTSMGRLSALSASWSWLDQFCFSRMGTTLLSWLDSCYVLHRLAGETDPRDFYQLEQYGTLGAGTANKIYSGFLEGTQSGSSSPMSWIDWSPKSSVSGSCQTIGLNISALGIGISSSGLMCEHWNITKYAAAGHFKQEWSCGCVIPFGQPYPNTREIRYMQAVSVPGGGVARWTLSAGYLAN